MNSYSSMAMQPIKRDDNPTSKQKKSTKSVRITSGSKSSRRDTHGHENLPTKTARIGLRVSPIREHTIRLASEVKEKSLSEFILDAAFREAEQTLLEQRLFQVSKDKFENFINLLDQPPMDNERLKKLFSKPSPWDE